MFQITAEDGKFAAKEVYASRAMTVHHGGVVLVGDYVYGQSDAGGWTCQEFKTGKVAWQERSKLGKGSISFADGMLYLRSEAARGRWPSLRLRPRATRRGAASISPIAAGRTVGRIR